MCDVGTVDQINGLCSKHGMLTEAEVSAAYCRRCEDEQFEEEDDFDDCIDEPDDQDEPPLFQPGKLAGMSTTELRAEFDRWADRQRALGDVEPTDGAEREIERAESRCELITAEIKRREAAQPEATDNG